MRRYTFFVFLLLVASGLSAQLINDGGTIVIQQNATLVVEGDIDNSNSGTITNNGIIKVKDNFSNTATLVSGAASEIVFTGDMNSEFTTNGASLAIVKNEKTAGDVILMDDIEVTEAVNFVGTSNFVLGAHSVSLADGATSDGTGSTGWFVTDDIGVVEKLTDAAGTASFDVGDASNFTPLSVVHSGTYSQGLSKISASVTNMDHPNLLADADSYISRYWTVNTSDIASYSGDMEGTFVTGDVNGMVGDIVGARYEANEWEFATGAATATTVTATSGSDASELTGKNFYGKADLTFFLQAAYDGSNTMNKTLNDLGLIPLMSPYDNTVASSIPVNAVDWIEIEVRDATTGSNVVSTTSAFLLTDGSVVGVDGSSLPLIKNALASTYVAVNHRNHLPIRTASQINLETPVNVNLSDAANVYNDPSVTTNDPQKDLGSGVMGLWMGDASGSNDTKYNGSGSDKIAVLIAVGFTTPNDVLSGYYTEDVDMDGDVAYNGSGSDKIKVLITVGFTTPNDVIGNHAQK